MKDGCEPKRSNMPECHDSRSNTDTRNEQQKNINLVQAPTSEESMALDNLTMGYGTFIHDSTHTLEFNLKPENE